MDGVSIDQVIDRARDLCDRLPDTEGYRELSRHIADLRERLAQGTLRLAVLGQFNRGKSTFINALLGLPVLPVSVLPITSVPTVIRHGPSPRCAVRFRDGRPDAVAHNSAEEIGGLLSQFVAEENNPRNRHGVAEATVYCDSAILRHGTVLIDTPGFGSTHVHNTETTLALLEHCDAALFLLSADLPITQVEVDFLQDVKHRVRRIFVIFNKVDLLHGDELRTTQEFVRSILIREGVADAGTRLFPVKAREAQTAGISNEEGSVWQTSGMEAVRTEIVDFMLREKYYALSEALDTKLRDALNDIVGLLDDERAEMEGPLSSMAAVAEEAARQLESARTYAQGALRALEDERSSLAAEIDSLADTAATVLATRLVERLAELLEHSLPGPSRAPLFESSLGAFLLESLNRTALEISARINRRLTTVGQAHSRALARARAASAEPLNGEPAGAPTLGNLEITPDPAWRPLSSLQFHPLILRRSFSERLSSRQTHRRRLLERLPDLLEQATDKGCRELAEALKERTTVALHEYGAHHSRLYQEIADHLGRDAARRHQELAAARAEAQPRVDSLRQLSEEFAKVRDLLV